MSLAKRISEHPWLSLTVSGATIVSTALALAAIFSPSDGRRASPEASLAVPASEPAALSHDLVGVWTLESPNRPGWTVAYKADGTYVLTMPYARVQGVYEAANGAFTSRAPDLGSEDAGRYRLLDANTLEMTGRLGTSVWQRQN